MLPTEFEEDWEDEEDIDEGGDVDDGGDGDDQLLWKFVGPLKELVADSRKLLSTLFNLGV